MLRGRIGPSAETMDFITDSWPIVTGQGEIFRLVSPTGNAGRLRHDERVDVRIPVTVAPRPDVAQNPGEEFVRTSSNLFGQVTVGDGGSAGGGLNSTGKASEAACCRVGIEMAVEEKANSNGRDGRCQRS